MVRYTLEQRAERKVLREKRRWLLWSQKRITGNPPGSAYDRRKFRRHAAGFADAWVESTRSGVRSEGGEYGKGR